MTLQSRRKRPTTAPNTTEAAKTTRPLSRCRGRSRAAACAAAIALAFLLADNHDLSSVSGGEPDLRVVDQTSSARPHAGNGAATSWSAKRARMQWTADSLKFRDAAPRSSQVHAQPPRTFVPAHNMMPLADRSRGRSEGPAGRTDTVGSWAPSAARSPRASSPGTGPGDTLSWRAPDRSPGDNAIRQVSYPALEPARLSDEASTGSRALPQRPAFDPFADPFQDRKREPERKQLPVRKQNHEEERDNEQPREHSEDQQQANGERFALPLTSPRAVERDAAERPEPRDQADASAWEDPIPVPPSAVRYTPAIRPVQRAVVDRDDKRRCSPALNNDRDCCQELEVCRDARELVRAATLDRISVDITPRFSPDEDDPVEEQRRLSEQLGRAPDRVWRDKYGRELAEGRLVNLARGRVLVVTDEGQTREIPFNELHEEDLCFVTAWWNLPTECGLGQLGASERQWMPITMTWKASAVCNKPLYFEEVQLERYGHTTGPLIQPALSTAHFFFNIAFLPYKAGIHPPNECQYALGYYRPGNCAPWLLPPVPLSLRGLAAEAAAVGGLIAIIQ